MISSFSTALSARSSVARPAVSGRTCKVVKAASSTPRRAVLVRSQASASGSSEAPASAAAPSSAAAAAPPALPDQAIKLTDAAVAHLRKMRAELGGAELLLRVGVKAGGCSGMSYVMDFESRDKVGPDDTVLTAGGGGAGAGGGAGGGDGSGAAAKEDDGLRIVCDAKSMLYIFGMQLDYSSALIGGGFKFSNPNATETCGCGTSFTV